MSAKQSPVLQVDDLHVEFTGYEGVVNAVRGVDISINEGESLGLVGESGCGKTVTALALMQLVPRSNGRITKGRIRLWRGGRETDIATLDRDSTAMREIRGKDIAMVFQEPMTSLNPSFTVGFQIMESINLHQKVAKRDVRRKAVESLRDVGLPDPEEAIDRYPHELSGGMRQRVMIAMAVACNPRLLIADEPTTALDVTVQAQILDLMRQYRNRYKMSMLWITHDLGVVGELCDNVMVMYLGQVVEYSSVPSMFEHPKHPYSQGLLRCLPRIGGDVKEEPEPIQGNVPSPYETPVGCAFAPRCPRSFALCHDRSPSLAAVEGSQVRCWLYGREEEKSRD